MNHESTIREWKSYRAAKPLHGCNQGGFALIAAISVMALLVMVALAMLSLSTVELRNARNSSHQDIARANARTGLMLALGELQKTVGPDQRITAPSQIFEDAEPSGPGINHQHLTGVWTARNEELGESPVYGRDNSFQRWLVSNSDPDGDPSALEETGFARSGVLNDPVVMVGDLATSGSPMAEVEAGKIEVSQGKIAWWVGDENCKGYTAPTDTVARQEGASIVDHLASVATPGAYGMESVDEDFPANTLESDKVATLEGLTLVSSKGDAAREWFHDLSPYAKGILSNVTKGGLRKDLNLYLEMPRPNDPWPKSGGPDRIGPNGKYALSELDEYDVLSWKRLHEHYHFKENVEFSNDGRPELLVYKNGVSDMLWNNGRLRPSPVLARLLIFVSFGSIEDPDSPANPDDPQYVLRFYTYPVVTLWNPYNVDLVIPANQMSILATSFPMEHLIRVNGQIQQKYNWRSSSAGDNAGNGVKPFLDEDLTLRAGEAKMLSPNGLDRDITYAPEWTRLHQVHKVRDVAFSYSRTESGGPGGPGGLWGEGFNNDRKITAGGGAADLVAIETNVSVWERGGNAYVKDYPATWDFRMSNSDQNDSGWETYLFSNKVGWRYELGTPAIAKPDSKLDRNNLPTATFGEIFEAPLPFLVVDARLKALDEEALPNKTWRDTIPSFPFQAVTKDQQANDASAYFSQAYALDFVSINSPEEAAGYLQSPPDNPTNTYFGGSYFPAGGQSFITDREIPLAPLSSIAQLQHLPQHSHDNLFASGLYFQNRAIGNSYASPGVRADSVKDSGMPFNLDMWSNLIFNDGFTKIEGGDINGMGYARDFFHQRPNIDRSYAANHLLWDDYFFSSMAAKNSKLRTSSERATLEEVVRGFYEDGEPLANSRYRPYFTGEPSDVINELIDGSGQPIDDAYEKVASHLTVEGMFNVNSTSVEAWKTLLASAHKKKMVVMEASGGTPSLDKEARYVVSRFTMPNGGSADEPGATDPEQLKWRGYRELTETQIEELAEAMVRQVKERGPFRSLAEFVNRRLAPESDDKSLYGALQAALEDPDVSINEEYQDDEITAADILDANYPNERAALGSRFQGSPAYVNQADILNAIGPVLSARSDTFIIRGYGESLDIQGNVLAKTWCEAVVQRTPDYIDSRDQPQIEHAELTSDLNRAFGRKFRVVSFRWLSGEEV